MKLRTFITTFALVAAPVALQAQSPITTPMAATGTLLSSVAVSVVTALEFGTMADGANAAEGEFSISSNQDIAVALTFAPLVHTIDGTSSIALSGTCKVGTTFASATAIACASDDILFPGLATKSLYVSGSALVDVASHPAGSYVGSATLVTTYTNY